MLLCALCLRVVAVAIISSVGAPGNVLIILLALLEPAFILYLVYWRSNRKDASLDAVIKLFAVGTPTHVLILVLKTHSHYTSSPITPSSSPSPSLIRTPYSSPRRLLLDVAVRGHDGAGARGPLPQPRRGPWPAARPELRGDDGG